MRNLRHGKITWQTIFHLFTLSWWHRYSRNQELFWSFSLGRYAAISNDSKCITQISWVPLYQHGFYPLHTYACIMLRINWTLQNPVFAIINTNIFQPYWMCNCENKLFFQSETWNIVVHNGGQQMTSNLWNVLVSEKKLSMHKIKIYYHGKCTCAIFILSMWWIKKLNCSLHSLICFFDALQPVNKICLCALSME